MIFDIKITTPKGVYKGGQGLSQYFGLLFNKFENIVGETEMDKMGEILQKSNQQNILQQRKANGSPLGNWAESTRKARMRKGTMGMKLVDTTELLYSIAYDRIGKMKRRVEAKAPHAGYVQFAKSRKWQFFGVGKSAMSELQKYLTELLRTRLRNAN